MNFEISVTKDEVMEWMLDIQLGRRNLSPIQRIAVTEKYRPIYEKQARENISKVVTESNKNRVNSSLVNLPKMEVTPINPSEKLASIAGVSEKTYRMGAKVLNSDNKELKQRVLSGETSISAGYKEIREKEIRICKMCGKEKKIIDFFGNDTICKECI